jgi:hypothetical protein
MEVAALSGTSGMNRRWQRALLGLLVVFSMCAEAGATDREGAAKALAGDLKKLSATDAVLGGWRGNDSKVDEFAVERVMDGAAWRALWARHAPGETAPYVDFEKAMVIAIFGGSVRTSVVSGISLFDVQEHDRIDLTVKYFVYDVIRDERANPYLFAVLRRSDKAIRVLARSFALMRDPQEREDVWKDFEAIKR